MNFSPQYFRSPAPDHTNALINLSKTPSNHPFVWHRIETGALLRVAGRFAVSARYFHSLPHQEQGRLRAIAAGLSSYSAVAISAAAAHMHRLPVAGPAANAPTEMSLPNNNLPPHDRHIPGIMFRKTRLNQHDIIDGIRCVNPARAVIDVARFHGFISGLIAGDAARALGITPTDFRREIEFLGRARNIQIARRVAELSNPSVRHVGESYARALILSSGLLRPHLNDMKLCTFASTGALIGILLNNWLAVEVEDPACGSTQLHASALQQRDDALRHASYRPLRLRYDDLTEHPRRTEALLLSHLKSPGNFGAHAA
ncbi:hypothetical protein ACUY2E_07355 [Corynebacterium confusum]